MLRLFVDKTVHLFQPINVTVQLLRDVFVNPLLQVTCSGNNSPCPKGGTRVRVLDRKYKKGLDLIFVLDSSNSIKKENFKIAKNLIQTVVRIFGVDTRYVFMWLRFNVFNLKLYF